MFLVDTWTHAAGQVPGTRHAYGATRQQMYPLGSRLLDLAGICGCVDLFGEISTIAIHSRTQLGHGDQGFKSARIERWLDKLKKVVLPAQ